jgi:hypothetical protein
MKTAHYFLWVGLGLFFTNAHAEEAISTQNGQKNTITSLEKLIFSGDSSGSSLY